MEKKLFLGLLLGLAIMLAGCKGSDYGTQTTGGASAVFTGEVKEFSMTAQQWSFDPSTITVQQGDNVRISIRSIDVTHGISLPAFGVNEELRPGKRTIVEFVATKKGTFPFTCSVICGKGHPTMRGQVVVE